MDGNHNGLRPGLGQPFFWLSPLSASLEQRNFGGKTDVSYDVCLDRRITSKKIRRIGKFPTHFEGILT